MQHRQEAEPIIGKKGLRVIAAISSPSIRQMTAASLSFSLREHFTSVVDTGSTGTMSEPLRTYAVGSASMYVEMEAAVATAGSDVRLNATCVL
jgi:hypothetical protein